MLLKIRIFCLLEVWKNAKSTKLLSSGRKHRCSPLPIATFRCFVSNQMCSRVEKTQFMIRNSHNYCTIKWSQMTSTDQRQRVHSKMGT